MAVAVAVAVAVSGGGAVAVAVAVAGLTKRFFNHIQKDFFINVWGYCLERELSMPCRGLRVFFWSPTMAEMRCFNFFQIRRLDKRETLTSVDL